MLYLETISPATGAILSFIFFLFFLMLILSAIINFFYWVFKSIFYHDDQAEWRQIGQNNQKIF